MDLVEGAKDPLLKHIRQLLLNYVVANITTDYIQLTEDAVPTVDPNCLILPPDPFDTLTRIYALGSQEPSQEKLPKPTPAAIQYIKDVLKPQALRPSESVAFRESTFESYLPLYQPMSPVLTARARRETPRPRADKFLRLPARSHSEFLASQSIKPVEVKPISETVPKQDEVLDTDWRLHKDEEPVRSFLLSVFKPCQGYKNRHLDFSSRPDSPPTPNQVPDPPFIPIFPRRRRAGSGVRVCDPPPSGLKGVGSLRAVILPLVKVEEPDHDLYTQNMVVVDEAFKSSVSPTPTPTSSQDEIDELSWSSPNTTPPAYRPTKMVWGRFSCPLYKTFLRDSLLTLETASSMVGQTESTCDSIDANRDDFDADLVRLYEHQRQDPRDLILKEPVDEKRQLLIDDVHSHLVPVLPPPNQHPPNALFLPSKLKELVAPAKGKGQADVKIPVYAFLKKAKGIPSLNVELSWVPIAAKIRIPTHSEVLNVADLLEGSTQACPNLPTQVSNLLEDVLSTPYASKIRAQQETWSYRYGETLFQPATSNFLNLDVARCELILSRKERRRLAGLTDDFEDNMEDSDDQLDAEDAHAVEGRSAKRPRLTRDIYLDDSGIAFDSLDVDLPPSIGGSYFYDHQSDGDIVAEYDEQFTPDDPRIGLPAHSRQDADHGEFMALSFGSHPAISAQPTQLPPNETSSDETYASRFEPHPDAIVNNTSVARPSGLPDPPDIATRSLGILEFAKLRAKKVSMLDPDSHPEIPQDGADVQEPPRGIPEDIYAPSTIRLPLMWDPPTSPHRYMVSMDVLQKQSLLRSLRSRACAVDVVERGTLRGVDIILDPHSAIIFSNLLVLPFECADLVKRIAQQSWLYSRLLILFEAYPVEHSYQCKMNSDRPFALFAYTPPVLKAVRKLRRDLDIMSGCGTKRAECLVQHANNVDETAKFTRFFGDFVQANDEYHGMPWGDRTWLEDDIPEVLSVVGSLVWLLTLWIKGEIELAAVDGTNRFAAFVILCQIDLGDFLEFSAEERMAKFGDCVGLERMMLLNQVIEQRLQAMQPSESDVVNPLVWRSVPSASPISSADNTVSRNTPTAVLCTGKFLNVWLFYWLILSQSVAVHVRIAAVIGVEGVNEWALAKRLSLATMRGNVFGATAALVIWRVLDVSESLYLASRRHTQTELASTLGLIA
ncbi:hypothetical protein GGX14DRAFT_388883 [Mycena pura]|uniref:Uncharacterized protein n=1 Tax=Mycena pura TaxID=153505 RepID=A0AAD6VVA6_9AGAR|nr:hypothetical protein GGX14DRAFT_388883 [Mycena pura]